MRPRSPYGDFLAVVLRISGKEKNQKIYLSVYELLRIPNTYGLPKMLFLLILRLSFHDQWSEIVTGLLVVCIMRAITERELYQYVIYIL